MSDKNYMARQGVTDEELIAEYGDPGSKDIDFHAAEVQRGRNEVMYTEQGMNPKQAKMKAQDGYMATMRRIKKAKSKK